MLAAKIAIVLAASSLVSVAIADTSCERTTGYKDTKCGSGSSQTCCKYNQKCLEIKPYEGDTVAVCSAARQLSYSKAIKIVIVPLFFMLFQIALAAYVVLRCNKSPTAMICAVVIALSWPFFYCKYWDFGAYSIFLAAMIACAASSQDWPKMPWLCYRLIWALGLFQIIALLGPVEAFHVPLFSWSKTAANEEFIKNVYGEADCDTYYESYFTILSAEKNQKEFDPDATYFGYCSANWLATVQSFAVVHALLWMGVVLLSGRDLLSLGKGSGSTMAKMLFGEAGKGP